MTEMIDWLQAAFCGALAVVLIIIFVYGSGPSRPV